MEMGDCVAKFRSACSATKSPCTRSASGFLTSLEPQAESINTSELTAANRMLFTIANCHAKKHRFEPALALLAECERRFIASGHVAALPELANVQGFLFANMVRWVDAEQAFARCATGAARLQNRYMMAFGLWNLARPLAHRRQAEAAARIMAFSQRYWTANFGELVISDLRYIEQVRRLIRVQIGAAALDRHWDEGLALPLKVALELAARSLALAEPAAPPEAVIQVSQR